MRRKNAPADHLALLILDMVTEFEFPDARRILRGAQAIAPAIARLKRRAHAARIPVIYVNDTAGAWESDQKAFVERCSRESSKGHAVVRQIRPEKDDYFIFKPRHSAFFATPLDPLLEKLEVRTLVLTGMTSHQCVLFTGMDAHVRGYGLSVPRDCIAAASRSETAHALFIFEHALNARVLDSSSVRF